MMIKMTLTLNNLEMYAKQQYEVILTSWNEDGTRNAAPFGTIVKDETHIINRIFDGSTTLKNILRNREFTVNITSNPIYFTRALIDNIPYENYVNDDSLILNDIDAYFNGNVIETKYVTKKDDPISPTETCYIESEVNKIFINKEKINVINRGIHCIIESLVNYSRIDKVNDEQKKYYMGRFRENRRVTNKVGSKADKEAMKYIISNLEKKGYSI